MSEARKQDNYTRQDLPLRGDSDINYNDGFGTAGKGGVWGGTCAVTVSLSFFTNLLYFQDVRVDRERARLQRSRGTETNLATFTAADESVLARN